MEQEHILEELNGRMIACQILITGLIARVANNSTDPLGFLSEFRDEIKAVVAQIKIAGSEDNNRQFASGDARDPQNPRCVFFLAAEHDTRCARAA